MSLFQINGVLPLVYPNNVNKASDYTCIVFVFIYSLGYSLGFGPAAWVYGSEVWCITNVNFVFSRQAAHQTLDFPYIPACPWT